MPSSTHVQKPLKVTITVGPYYVKKNEKRHPTLMSTPWKTTVNCMILPMNFQILQTYAMKLKDTETIVPMNMVILHDVDCAQRVN